jgi:hypothetical protein
MNEATTPPRSGPTINEVEEACDELEREYNLRERLYPGWIKSGSLSRADARDRQKRLAWAIEVLKPLCPPRADHNNGGPDDAF